MFIGKKNRTFCRILTAKNVRILMSEWGGGGIGGEKITSPSQHVCQFAISALGVCVCVYRVYATVSRVCGYTR